MIKDKEVEKTMLNVKNLTFEVNEEGKKRCLVNHISFQVEDGEMLVITGPNGGGKSTLAKVLAGIEKPTAEKFFWMMRILQSTILTTAQTPELVMHSSSRPVSKG